MKHGPKYQPKKGEAREFIVAMRKQHLSIHDVESALKTQGAPLNCTAICEILLEEGFFSLPSRLDEERPQQVRPTQAEGADHHDY